MHLEVRRVHREVPRSISLSVQSDLDVIDVVDVVLVAQVRHRDTLQAGEHVREGDLDAPVPVRGGVNLEVDGGYHVRVACTSRSWREYGIKFHNTTPQVHHTPEQNCSAI